MRILATGVAGGVGKVVTPHLMSIGHNVRGFDRLVPPFELADMVIGDVRQGDDLIAAARGCSAVLHMAAIPGNRPPFDELLQINLIGVFNALAAAEAVGMTHIVNFSSICATGILSEPPMPVPALPYSEAMDAAPADCYGMGKLMGEVLCRGHQLRLPETSVRCLRPGLVVHDDSAAAMSLEFPNAVSFSGDIADAVARCLESAPGFGVYHATSRRRYTKEGALLTPDQLRDDLMVHGVDPAIADECYLGGEMGVYDISAAEKDLEWSPRW